MQYDRRQFLGMCGAAAALPALGCLTAARREEGALPNIVLCMADDQGWGDMAYNGHPALKTPNFDAMAKTGLRFNRFYAAAPVCSPTRGSVMTGRHPNRFGCFSWGRTLRPQEITIAEALKQAGYVTGHFGKWHLGSVRDGSPVNPGESGFDEWLSAPNFFDNDPILSREGKAVQTEGESSMVTVDAALDFIRRRSDADRPFLAVVWFGSPHKPHRAAPEYRAMYADVDEKYRDFYGEITGMDAAFGKLRNALGDLGIRDNTMLWYCSDNGGLPKVGATGGRGHKGQVYEGGLRVPALLEWPARLPTPAATDMPCVTSDIYPTLLEFAGVRVPNQPPLDGVSLAPLLEGDMRVRTEPIGFWDYPAKGIRTPSAEWMSDLLDAQQGGGSAEDPERLRLDAGSLEKKYDPGRLVGHAAWLDWPWKLHRKQGNPEQTPVFELYNLEVDPMEANDLAGDRGERAGAMRAQLEDWQRSVIGSLNGGDY